MSPPIPPPTPSPSPPLTLLGALRDAVELAVRGKSEQVELVLLCCAAGGHVLLEDLPGTGKTTLAKALARAMGSRFTRVQFTPDLLPGDIVGSSVFRQTTGRFRFRPGPIFTHVLIADEINRASPRTQSALLEALSEQQVSVEGKTRPLASPFLCVATQNPSDLQGTYPLPEASLDRFMVKTSLGYPPEIEERGLLTRVGGPLSPSLVPVVADVAQMVALQAAVDRVNVDERVADYVVRLVRASRQHPSLRTGVSTRGTLQLGRMARARAMSQQRMFVIPDDIKALAVPVLAHRLVLDTRARYAGADREAIVRELLSATALPR